MTQHTQWIPINSDGADPQKGFRCDGCRQVKWQPEAPTEPCDLCDSAPAAPRRPPSPRPGPETYEPADVRGWDQPPIPTPDAPSAPPDVNEAARRIGGASRRSRIPGLTNKPDEGGDK